MEQVRNESYPLPERLAPLDDALVETIYPNVAGVYFRSVLLKKMGTVVPQHQHDHDHATMICTGRARLWNDKQYVGDYEAGQVVEIRANRSHTWQALLPFTRLCCVHNVESAMSVIRKGL